MKEVRNYNEKLVLLPSYVGIRRKSDLDILPCAQHTNGVLTFGIGHHHERPKKTALVLP
jgi:hypothetical protein